MKKLILLLILAGGGYLGYLALREKPGEGPKALEGRRKAQPLIDAIERYRVAHNSYPADLEDLAADLGGAPVGEINGNPVHYTRHGNTFDLTFSYATPLPVHCTFSPATRWKCGYMKG